MVLAVAGVAFLLLNWSDSARAEGPAAATSPSVERASRPEPDGPVLNLLWLLTGASRRY